MGISKTSAKTAQDLNALARDCVREGQFDEAGRHLAQSLEQQPTPEAWREMGVLHRLNGDIDKAEACFDSALALDVHDDATLALMGEIYFDRGDALQAAGHYILAIRENAGQFIYKQRFIELAGLVPVYKYNPVLEETLLACLDTPGIDGAPAQVLWLTTLKESPWFKPFYKVSNAGGLPSFNVKSFDKMTDLKPLLNPFFLRGIGQFVVYNAVFEGFMTRLRQRLLEDNDAPKSGLARADLADLANAVARYCFLNEHIFDTTDEERARMAVLRQRLETDENTMRDASIVALYGCYAPMHELASAAKIAGFHAEGRAAGAVKMQITDYAALMARRDTVEKLTGIDDAVSQKVQQQYEEFPYPRWMAIPRGMADEEEGVFKGKKAKILVAGCGTGREAIQLAAAFPDAEVLGVYLSRTSLAYALGRAAELGIGNVTFRQADILKLDGQGKFDYVASSGVLHHMDDPMAGWSILTGLLKTGGLMRVALYSRLGRRNIAVARKAIEKGSYGADAESMKAFRAKSAQLLDRRVFQDVSNCGDYYHLSMYRDLLFHVQEHGFDVPGIAAALDKLGLEFIKFGVTVAVLAAYKKQFPSDTRFTNLDNWRQFEEKNSDTFAGMYHIWCRKRA